MHSFLYVFSRSTFQNMAGKEPLVIVDGNRDGTLDSYWVADEELWEQLELHDPSKYQ